MPASLDADVIVVGSGPAGVHAATPLVEAGVRVALIDGGEEEPGLLRSAPKTDFEETRRDDPGQHRWFLGDDLSGMPNASLAQGLNWLVQGNRSYVVRGARRLLPLETGHVRVLESLACGGLAAAWGAVCGFFSDRELAAAGLPVREMRRHYDIIARRIGVSGPRVLPGIQEPVRLDHHAEALMAAFGRRAAAFDALSFELVRSHLAILTAPLGGRDACSYTDMHHYADPGRSIYRPQYGVEELRRWRHFRHESGWIVERVEERDGQVEVYSRRNACGAPVEERVLRARRLILAAGAVGSARILLRTLGNRGAKTSFLTKRQELVACFHARMLGRAGSGPRLGLCQLQLVEREEADSRRLRIGAQLYSYRSFLLCRLLSAVPLPAPEAMQLLSLLTPALVIADIRYPALRHPGGTLWLHGEGRDARVRIEMEGWPPPGMERAATKRLRRSLRTLGLTPFRTVRPPLGSTTHYGGTIPISEPTRRDVLGADENGRLLQGKNIYIADASLFRCLPATATTFTIMANANRIAAHVLEELRAADAAAAVSYPAGVAQNA